MKGSKRKAVTYLVIFGMVLATMAFQVAPVLGLDSYQRLDRVGDKLIQGVAETTIPYLDSDDGYFYIVRASQTGTVTRRPVTTPSSYGINCGQLLGTNSLSNLSASDNIYWNARSSSTALNDYCPTSNNSIDATKWKSGTLSDVNANDSQYMSFESYDQYALNFTGSYYVDAGDTASLDITSSFTIEFRIKWTSIPSTTETHDIVSKYGSVGYPVYFTMTSTGYVTLYGLVRSFQTYSVSMSFPAALQSWYHIAFVYYNSYSNDYLYIYRNGTRYGNQPGSNPGSTPTSFKIGASGSPFNAKYTIDEVAVWRVAKWTGSSFTVPTTPYTGTESNLAGLWHMNEGSGTNVKDSSPNSNHGTATATPTWVPGYPFASTKNLEVEFSGTSNTFPFWGNLNWTTDLSWNASTVSVSIQLFNYTLGGYATSGYGFLSYTSSATPNVDETKTQMITVNPNDFKNSTTGAWKMKITGKAANPFKLNVDLVRYSTFNKARTEFEFFSTLSDYSNTRTRLSALNVSVEVKCNVTSNIQKLYLYDYTNSRYVLKGNFTVSMTDMIGSANITSGITAYVSSTTGQMKIKLNSTYAATYVVSIDLVQWTVRYDEPKWALEWRVDYKTSIPKSDMTSLSVRIKGNLTRRADLADLSLYSYSSSSWTRVMNVNNTMIQTQWYNTTATSDFFRTDGYLNVTMSVFDTNWTTVKSFADQLAVFVYQSTPDTTPPARIIDLAASNMTSTSITLTWTATGGDSGFGTATGYLLKYSKLGPVTNSTWDSSVTFSQSWTPLPAGRLETYTVSDLEPGTQYWFAIKAYDEALNNGTVSNSPSAYTTDITPPGQITDLTANSPTTDSITLTWTATGDDGYNGAATGLEVKYSISGPVTESNLNSSTTYIQSWVPLIAGSLETHVIYGLNSSTEYWFGIKAYDETPNYGAVSNSVDGTTLAPQTGNTGSLISILMVVIPISLVGVAGAGVIGMKAMGRSKQAGQKSPFRKRRNNLEGVARPRLREYVGENGVVPQPPKKAKFEQQETGIKKDEGGDDARK